MPRNAHTYCLSRTRSRLTRRMATVTISVSDAAILAAIASMLSYLPVPTNRRDLKCLPPMISLSLSIPVRKGRQMAKASVRDAANSGVRVNACPLSKDSRDRLIFKPPV